MRDVFLWLVALLPVGSILCGQEAAPARAYLNQLVELDQAAPLLADFPEFVEPVVEVRRFEAPPLLDEDQGELHVRAWRYSYNARGIIEIPNRLQARETAVIVVHPWGIDDGQGWNTPQPAGVALFCTPEKNAIYHRHVEQVVNPLLKRLRPHVGLVAYSLPGGDDPIRSSLYRGYQRTPDAAQRAQAGEELRERLHAFRYEANPVEAQLQLDGQRVLASYFRAFAGLDSSDRFNAPGFWSLPIPVVRQIEVAPRDAVIYDGLGYEPLRDFLRSEGIRNVLLCGYATDMCVCSTTAGYENLGPDFNVFLVGDATLAVFPASQTPRFATQAALCKAAVSNLITQVSWIRIGTQTAQSP